MNLSDERLVSPTNTLNKYVYGANNPLKFVDLDGKDATLFYNRDIFGTDHVFLVALNQDTGAVAGLDFNPSSEAGLLPGVGRISPSANLMLFGKTPGEVRDEYASLTIRTTPDQANEVIAWIAKFTTDLPGFNLTPGLFVPGGQNCATSCAEALHILGIESGSETEPQSLWDALFPKFSTTGDLNTLGHYPAQPNHEYGNPRWQGITSSQLYDLFQSLSSFGQERQLKGCVTTPGLNGEPPDTTCN
jgi:hypothetical protein